MGETLAGLRVVEIGRSDAARYCGMLFADFGATVVQLDDPAIEWQPHGSSYDYFGRMLDRGKHSAKAPGDPEDPLGTLREWLAEADILIDGGAHGGVAGLGLSYCELQRRHPELVIIGLSLAGRFGPSAHMDGCELLAAARSSDLQMTGWPHRPPSRSISPKAEIYAALWSFCGALAKLRLPAPERGGTVDVAYADALLSAMDGSVEHFFESGRNARRKTGEGTLYRVLDGYVVLYPGVTDPLWGRFCELLGRRDLISHPLMKDSSLRRRYPELVEEVVVDWISGKTRAQVIDDCRRGGVVVAPVQTLDEVVDDAQVHAMNLIVESGDGDQAWRCGGYPIELSRTPAVPRSRLGELTQWHEREALAPPAIVADASPASNSKGPLESIVVLDLGRGIASPYCSMILSDLGATVIRVEDPSAADKEFRNFSGSRRRNGVTETVLVGSYRERNKQSLLLDLSRTGAKHVLSDLVRHADVLVSNLAPGALDKLGFDEAHLRSLNSRLVSATNTGFGRRGPLSRARAVDPIAVAYSGMMSLGGFEGDPPTKPGQAQVDYLAGLGMAAGIVAALFERERSGVGQAVHTSLLAMAVTTLGGVLEQRLAEGRTPGRTGNSSYRFGDLCAVWPCQNDGFIAIDITAPAALKGFRDLLGSSRSDRGAQFEAPEALRRFAAEHDAHEGARILTEVGVPAAPVCNTREAAGITDFWVRDMFLHWDHPEYGSVVITGSPLRLDGHGLALSNLGPRPGESWQEVLGTHTSLDAPTIARLVEEGAIFTGG